AIGDAIDVERMGLQGIRRRSLLGVPELDARIAVGRGDLAAVRPIGDAIDAIEGPVETTDLAPVGGVPEDQLAGSVVGGRLGARPGDEARPVRAEGDGADPGAPGLEGSDQPAGLRIPEPDGRVARAGGDPSPVGAEGDGMDDVRMAGHRELELAGARPPDLDT